LSIEIEVDLKWLVGCFHPALSESSRNPSSVAFALIIR